MAVRILRLRKPHKQKKTEKTKIGLGKCREKEMSPSAETKDVLMRTEKNEDG